MTGPLGPPGDPGVGTPVALPPDEGSVGPSIFMSDYTWPAPGTVVIPPLPKSEGGVIQAIKTGVVQGLRDALQGSSLFAKGQQVYISLEYPMTKVQFPGIWVQFSISKLNRAGIGHEVVSQVNGNWVFIQEWMVEGRVTLSVVALKNLDRDRLSDGIICALAFARPPDLVLSNPDQNTQENRGFITALDENPFIAVTLQLDTIICGGEQVSQGTPWGDDAALVYENNFSFDLVGNFNIQFSQDGVYTLAEITQNISISETSQVYNPAKWLGTPQPQPVNPLSPGGQVNMSNTEISAF